MAPTGSPVGVLLAGGASRRMGRDKARLVVGGRTLAEGAAERLRQTVGEVVAADGGRGLVAGLPSLPDADPGRGPVAGILGAARAYPGRSLLVLACDLPRVPAALLAELVRVGNAGGTLADWAVPRHAGGLEPLCAFYAPGALAALAERVEHGRLTLWDLAETSGLSVRYLEREALARFGPPEEVFANLNTPDDLAGWAGESASY